MGTSGWFSIGGSRRARGVPFARNGHGVPALVVERPVPTVSVPVPVQFTIAAFRLVMAGLAWGSAIVARYPLTSLAVVGVLAAWHLRLLAAVMVAACALTLAGIGVAWWRPVLFAAWVTGPADRYRRRRRLARSWARLCRLCKLDVIETDPATGERVSWTPRLSRLRWTGPARTALAGTVRVVPGQTVDHLVDAAPGLASAAGARSCKVTITGANTATVVFLFGDPLTDPVPLQPLGDHETVDLTAVPIGLAELGGPWLLRLAGSHVLIAGSTGSGKSGVVWALLRGIAGHIREGRVQVWAIDGKAGVELSPGRAMFTRFATTVTDGLTLLEDAVALMQHRAALMAGVARTHTPTSEFPLIVVLIDEVALLTAYEPDRKRRDAALAALSLLATQGRALGFVLVATVQDPRQNVVGVRHLFPTRIGLRLDSASETDMVLGEAAVQLGASCHTIPEATPGVAYVKVDGHREPVRVRASWLDDTAITSIANANPTPNPATTAPGTPGRAYLAPVHDAPPLGEDGLPIREDDPAQDTPPVDAGVVTAADWTALRDFLHDQARPTDRAEDDAA